MVIIVYRGSVYRFSKGKVLSGQRLLVSTPDPLGINFDTWAASAQVPRISGREVVCQLTCFVQADRMKPAGIESLLFGLDSTLLELGFVLVLVEGFDNPPPLNILRVAILDA